MNDLGIGLDWLGFASISPYVISLGIDFGNGLGIWFKKRSRKWFQDWSRR